MKAKAILQEVKKTYSKIAHEFDFTRDRPWPEFEEFWKEMKKRLVRKGRTDAFSILDIGCGNGRLLDFFILRQARGDIGKFTYTGIDNNPAMIRIAKKKNPATKFRVADIAKRLPFPAGSFDTVWCIAVLHHLPTQLLRIKALKETRRVLKKNGLLMLTVWNLLPQKKYKQFINQKTHDAEIPWGKKRQWKRYCHAFTAPELYALLEKAGFAKIKRRKSRFNIAFVAYSSLR